jgi:uncharacterized protein with PIN domain
VATLTLHFADDLRLFLHRDLRATHPVQRTLSARTSIKDVIESCGIPHTEVDLILRNDSEPEALGFDWQVRSDSSVHVHSVESARNILPSTPRLQARHITRFVADVHLGKLARNLRLLGFDTLFDPDADDARLLELAVPAERALLTRDRRLLMHSIVRHGYCPRSTDPEQQTREVLRRFDLVHPDVARSAFEHCLRCNAPLEHVAKSAVQDQLASEPLTLRHYDEFLRCTGCGQIYWHGSHFAKLSALAIRLLTDEKSS